MELKLYLEIDNGDDLNFDVDSNYYQGEDYANALSKDYEASMNDVSNFCLTAKKSHLRQENVTVNGFGGFNTRVSEIEEKVAYTTCDVRILDENMEDETINGLIKHDLQNEMFMYFIEFNYDSIEEDFESDLRLWATTWKKIESMPYDDDWKIQNYPKRNFKFSYKNDYGGDGFGEFINCKIIGSIGGGNYCVLIEKINFLKEL